MIVNPGVVTTDFVRRLIHAVLRALLFLWFYS